MCEWEMKQTVIQQRKQRNKVKTVDEADDTLGVYCNGDAETVVVFKCAERERVCVR